MRNIYKDILFGVSIGDALGVPVEFKSREIISQNPVKDMIGFGSYNLPAGTFSDDSSLTFCLAESLTQSFSLQNVADKFILWFRSNYWTPYGNIFDIGNATREAILKVEKGCVPELAGGLEDSQNGNGSLMRILPLIDLTKDLPIEERFLLTKKVSSITHGHIRSIIACFYYLEFARQIILGTEKTSIYEIVRTDVLDFLKRIGISESEIIIFKRLLFDDIIKLRENEIKSKGYVVHTLEASIWCLLTTNDYSSAVLKAVNLGEDTDTTAAVTGGLAGLLYGFDTIPTKWINQLARKEDILDLAERWEKFASS